MNITSLDQVERIPMGMEGARNVVKQVPISVQDGAPNFVFRVFTIGPDGHTPYHRHAAEHLNYVISGHGILVSESGAEHPIEPGNFALVRPAEKHQYRNTSATEPLVLICAVPKEYE